MKVNKQGKKATGKLKMNALIMVLEEILNYGFLGMPVEF